MWVQKKRRGGDEPEQKIDFFKTQFFSKKFVSFRNLKRS